MPLKMDLTSPEFHHPPPLFSSDTIFQELPPPLEAFAVDPLCKLNLQETSDFVRAFPMPLPMPMPSRRREGVTSVTLTQRITAAADSPSTPGRPVFSFSGCNNGNYGFSRRGFPSKWDDAEKWLIKPQHHQVHHHQQPLVFADKSRVTQEKVSTGQILPVYDHGNHHLHHYRSVAGAEAGAVFNGVRLSVSASASPEFLLKDKFTDDVETILSNPRSSDPLKEGFFFKRSFSSSSTAAAKHTEVSDAQTAVVQEVKHRDAGTEMTPRGSSTNSRCHTPFSIPSPPRHNTPADRSGPLPISSLQDNGTTTNISRQLQECHLAKLKMGANQFDSVTSNWSSREEEEEEVSKSLRHFEADNNCNNLFAKTSSWEEEQNKCCLRYQREEARIQAWLNLENAKAEARSRKLEVKIQKMRSNLEEKLMKRMAIVHRKAEEWRAEARQHHTDQIHKTKKKFPVTTTTTMKTGCQDSRYPFARRGSCGCFQ